MARSISLGGAPGKKAEARAWSQSRPRSYITVVGCDLSSAKTKLDTPAGRSRKLLHALDRMFALAAPPSEKATAREDQAGQASADGGAGNRTRLGQT